MTNAGKMLCPNCGFENPGGMKFCGQCKTPLALVCPNCHFENPPGFKFCGQCTTALGSESIKPAVPDPPVTIGETDGPAAVDGERKTVTALFADIKGSMELMEDLDPEDARAIVDPALKLMIDAVQRYDGYLVQSTGDGIFALFGAPVAHEDHPQRAIHSALRLQDAIRTYSAKLVADGGTPLESRVGINTGEVVVRTLTTGGHAEYAPIGHTANLASRMEAIAPTGSIAITEHTRRLVEGFFQLKPRGPTRVKGLAEPINVYEVSGLGPLRTRLQRAAARGLTKFVGRQREMETPKCAAEEAQTGHGQIVAVIADPGIGKSRLFYEFKTTSQSGWTVLEAFSVSHGKASSYLPVLELLSVYFGINRDDDDRRRRELILGKVLGLDRSLEDTLLYLFALHGVADATDSMAQMEPQLRRQRTLEAIKRILLRESLNQPLMVIFEDLHWIDSETQALLNLVVDAIANARILLLVNYRPEYRHEWDSRTHYTQLRLDPLGTETAEEMLVTLVGNAKDLNPLKRLIIERTQGTPFFIEEMVQSLFDEGVLRRNGTVAMARPMSAVKVPPTVQAVLASRIDRLPSAAKELLQTLAVLGHEFALALVQRVTVKDNDKLEQILYQLQLAEFIYEQPAVGDIEYSFKHALTQDVAYNSILAERRRALHDRTAHALEELYACQLDDHYSDLARHYLRGNEADKAVHYAQLAAQQSSGRGAYIDATNLVNAALNLLDRMPESNQRLRAELGLRGCENIVAFALHGPASPERQSSIRRMCELGEKLEDSEQLLRGLIGLGGVHYARSESVQALEVVKRCFELAQTVQDAALLTDLDYLAGLQAFFLGNLREGASHLDDAALHSSRTSRRISNMGLLYASSIQCIRAATLQLLGRVGDAARSIEEGLRRAREARHLFSVGHALAIGALVAHYRRQPEVALGYAQEAIALCEENGFVPWPVMARYLRGRAIAELGQIDQGIDDIKAAIDGLVKMVGAPLHSDLLAQLSSAYARAGETEKALAILEEAHAHCERSGENRDRAELFRLKGELLLMSNPETIAQVEACFRTALQFARAQGAKWWELRTSVSLARLLRDSNRRNEAHTMLAEIYNWFTDGFDLPDLTEARGMLDELSTE
jgi:class 3 adenylate cyclase/tetratricopeptide (TPR) repeat protein